MGQGPWGCSTGWAGLAVGTSVLAGGSGLCPGGRQPSAPQKAVPLRRTWAGSQRGVLGALWDQPGPPAQALGLLGQGQSCPSENPGQRWGCLPSWRIRNLLNSPPAEPRYQSPTGFAFSAGNVTCEARRAGRAGGPGLWSCGKSVDATNAWGTPPRDPTGWGGCRVCSHTLAGGSAVPWNWALGARSELSPTCSSWAVGQTVMGAV